jgi:hypothetical protein
MAGWEAMDQGAPDPFFPEGRPPKGRVPPSEMVVLDDTTRQLLGDPSFVKKTDLIRKQAALDSAREMLSMAQRLLARLERDSSDRDTGYPPTRVWHLFRNSISRLEKIERDLQQSIKLLEKELK